MKIENWRHSQNGERGVVALMTTIIVSLLLVVVTISGARIMSAELRQATDFDLSVKAYFAAESGVEDAIAEIRRNGVENSVSPGCEAFNDSDANLSSDGVVAYTCQVVSLEQTALQSELKKEASVQIDLAGLDFNRLVVSWNQEGSSDPAAWDGAAIPPQFPPGTTWSDQYPAVMEATFVSYPQTSSFDSADITSQVVILKPSSSGVQNNPINIQSASNPETVRCTPSAVSGSYECQASLQLPPANRNYVVRLHARYSSTHYKIEAFKGNNPVDIPNTQLTVDVTGKAGDVFRRIQAKSFLSQSTSLPFVILADDSICKVLEVTGPNATSETGC